MPSLLIVDDELTWLKNAARFLERAGHSVRTASTLQEGLSAYREEPPDAVLLDYQLPDGTGLAFIREVRRQDASVRILLVTGHGSIELAVEAMKAGANDLLTKPVALPELRERLESIGRQQREEGRLRYYEGREREASQALIGQSEAMRTLRQRIERIAAVDAEGMLPPVLITGETGTGKELTARACHFQSARAGAPFVEVNCAAIPASLLEATLFGHERGAFTDAKERKLGLLEAADGGTLFLDEIGEMDINLQAKLLKVLEDGRFRRIGAVQERQLALRIVAATNQDLEARVASGQFRADLYFRLRVLTLAVPALRERGTDVQQLATHFCEQLAQRYRRGALALTPEALQALQAHPWPGNVRELRNLLEQAVLMAAGSSIGVADLALPPGTLEALRTTSQAAPPLTPDMPTSLDPAAPPGSLLERQERATLVQALQTAGGNVSQAARALGISRDTLRYRMEKHGL